MKIKSGIYLLSPFYPQYFEIQMITRKTTLVGASICQSMYPSTLILILNYTTMSIFFSVNGFICICTIYVSASDHLYRISATHLPNACLKAPSMNDRVGYRSYHEYHMRTSLCVCASLTAKPHCAHSSSLAAKYELDNCARINMIRYNNENIN